MVQSEMNGVGGAETYRRKTLGIWIQQEREGKAIK